jgi:RNA polymerase sigma-70 factor, ECF subfamily
MAADTTTHQLTAADRQWFGEQVEQLLPELFGAAVRLCPSRADAEDLVAETVTKAWGALRTLEDRAAFRAWMFRILNNTFVSNCRSASAQAVHEPLETTGPQSFSLFERLHQPILLWWGNPEQEFLNRLLREDLEEAIDGLPDVYREVVIMVDAQGLRYQDVADLLHIPVGTVRSRLSRGRSLLQEALWLQAQEAGLAVDPPAHPTREKENED